MLANEGQREDAVGTPVHGVAARLAEDPTVYDDRRDRQARGTAEAVGRNLVAANGALVEPRNAIERAVQLASHLGHESVAR